MGLVGRAPDAVVALEAEQEVGVRGSESALGPVEVPSLLRGDRVYSDVVADGGGDRGDLFALGEGARVRARVTTGGQEPVQRNGHGSAPGCLGGGGVEAAGGGRPGCRMADGQGLRRRRCHQLPGRAP